MVSVVWMFWLDCIAKFIDINIVIIILINQRNDATKIQYFNIVRGKNFLEFLSCDKSFVLIIEKTIALFDIKCLMAIEDFFGNFDLPLVFEHEFDQSQEHEVFYLTLFLF